MIRLAASNNRDQLCRPLETSRIAIGQVRSRPERYHDQAAAVSSTPRLQIYR